MSRYGRELHLDDLDEAQIERTAESVRRVGFWAYVDSQEGYPGPHYGDCPTVEGYYGALVACHDWVHVRDGRRGDSPTQCIAARSDRGRCNQWTRWGVPFCSFHFDAAYMAMCAFIAVERRDSSVQMAEFRYDQTLRDCGMDVAMVRDARRALANGNERVYFFAANHAVKIGRSIDPAKRVKTLGATKAPADVDIRAGRLMGTIPGGCQVEGELHRRFRLHRLVGEWFELEPIRADIDALITAADEECAA